MVARFENPVRRVAENTRGRDFVVGDIHGCFDLVLRAMDKVRFDQSRDRILSVGDLIDRGPGSHRTVRFLSHDWVLAIRGNHEDMLLEIHQDGEPHEGVMMFMASRNGMGWWLETPDELKADILAAVARLPLAMEVDTHRGKVGLVHADVPKGMDWPSFTAALEAGDAAVAEVALWGRDRVRFNDTSGIPGIGRVFVGHTPLARMTKLGNLYAIDTGAVYAAMKVDEGALSFADVTTMTNVFKTIGSMKKPDDLVTALTEADRSARPFSGI